MHDHNSFVFPHHTNGEPKDNPDEEKVDIPRCIIKSREAISDELNESGNPFDDIDFFHCVPQYFGLTVKGRREKVQRKSRLISDVNVSART